MKKTLKKLASVLLAACLMLGLVACGNPVKKDIVNYFDKELGAYEKEMNDTLDSYNALIAKSATITQEELVKGLNEDLIPKYEDLYEKISKIKPETEEVQKFHDTYVEALKLNVDGMKKVSEAVEKTDQSLMAEAQKIATEAQNKMNECKEIAQDFQDKYKVKISLYDDGSSK